MHRYTSTAPRRGRFRFLRSSLAGIGATLVAVTVGFLLVRVSPGPELIFRPIADPGLTLTPARPLGSWPRYDYGVGDPTVLLTASIDVAYWKWLHTRLLSPVLSVPLAATGVVAAVAELLVRRR